ncbi:MAG: amidohydrolase family protein [Pyrinomonadaceae bacterium]
MKTPIVRCANVLFIFAFISAAPAQAPAYRTIEFETTQVTAPDIALTQDSKNLIFTMLGKLFRMPVKGGEAEQLTFGPYFDDNPAVSPDGKSVVFDSDRDGSAGNIFLLDLTSLEIKQLTHEDWADRPIWSADGNAIIYLHLDRNEWKQREVMARPPAEIRRVTLDGSNTQTLQPQGNIAFAFYLSDGRLAWAVVDGVNPNLNAVKTRIESLRSDGSVEVIRNSDFLYDQVQTNSNSRGIYTRTQKANFAQELTLFSTSGPDRRVAPLSGEPSSFALTPDGFAGYVGSRGLIWKVMLPNGRMDEIPFRAKVRLEIHSRPPTRTWTTPDHVARKTLRTVSEPRLSPDGTKLLFIALRNLWEQPLSEGSARRLTNTSKFSEPFTISPDGTEVGFVEWQKEGGQIQVLELASAKQRTIAGPNRCGYEQLSWSASGQLAAATACEHDLLSIDTRVPSIKVLLKKSSDREPWPSISPDGKTLYFQATPPGAKASHFKLDIMSDGKPEAVRAASEYETTYESAGRFAAESIPNSVGVRVFPISSEKIETFDLREPDGEQFSIAPDGKSLIYVEGNKVWRQPFDRTPRIEIPIRISISPPRLPSYLIDRARVLDIQSGIFSTESSLLIVNGRISSVGANARRSAPKDAVKVNAEGRFIIPGLWEMHGHANDCAGPGQLIFGVTSVRNMGGRIEIENEQADRSDLTDEPLPRCFYSGRILEGAQGRREDWYFIHPANEEEARMYVRRAKDQGAHFIKLYERLPWPLQRAAADEAHRIGLPVSAHSGTVERVVKGINAGYDGLTHHFPASEDLQQMVKYAGVHWDPTLGVHGRAILARNEPNRFDIIRRYIPNFSPWNTQALPQLSDAALQGFWLERTEAVRTAFRRGITVVPGTDSPGPLNGISLQWELEYFEQARVPRIDIMRSATINSARVMGADGQLGSIETGKLADILILDANPLEAIRNTQKIWRVFKGGRMFDPKTLLLAN